MADETYVILTISDKFTVTCPGFSHAMECKALAWGRISVPYYVWKRLMRAVTFLPESDVTVTAENGKIELAKLSISNPKIQVTHMSSPDEGKP
jgi:hypothetical protein